MEELKLKREAKGLANRLRRYEKAHSYNFGLLSDRFKNEWENGRDENKRKKLEELCMPRWRREMDIDNIDNSSCFDKVEKFFFIARTDTQWIF